jgi:hypothetical protein
VAPERRSTQAVIERSEVYHSPALSSSRGSHFGNDTSRQIETKASEVWWQLLFCGALIGFVGLDGVVGIIGQPGSGTFSQALAFVVLLIGSLLALLGLIAGFVRLLKWTWRDLERNGKAHMSELDEIVERRRNQCAAILESLLAAPQVVLDKSLERSLPDAQGVYAIAQKGAPIGEYLHAGKTKTSRQPRGS